MHLPGFFLGGKFLTGIVAGLLLIAGGASAVAQTKPDLRITEVHPDQVPSPSVPGGDWWELTSFAASTVDLSGWRFNDNTGDLTGVFVIPNGVAINPGESIIFAEATTPEEFTAWWGAANLPQGQKIINYTGSGLGFGAMAPGDGIRLWNATTASATDTVASVDFGAATEGVSFNYNPTTGVFGQLSQPGVNGVLKAALTDDIGSPGRITGNVTPPVGPQLSIQNLATGRVRISFATVAGRTYTLEQKSAITAAWAPAGQTLNATATAGSFDIDAAGTESYFRVKVQ